MKRYFYINSLYGKIGSGNMLPDWYIKRISTALGVTEDSVLEAQKEMVEDKAVQYYLEKYPLIDKAAALVGWIMCEIHYKREDTQIFTQRELGLILNGLDSIPDDAQSATLYKTIVEKFLKEENIGG